MLGLVHRAIDAWTTAATAREKLENTTTMDELRVGGRGGMPEDRLIPACDSDQPRLAATELEETYRERLALASVTLNAQAGEAI